MMVKVLKILITGIFLFAITTCSFAQKWEIKGIYDDIVISYKWRKEKILKKESPLILLLSIKNNRARDVLVKFAVNYYWEGILHSSSNMNSYCIKKNRKIRGKLHGLAYSSGEFTEEQIHDELFIWEISDFEVTEATDCKPELIIQIKTVKEN
jgi:ribonucleotide reductase beta subunit family protein with ferritin-like domain